ncbi:MAG: DNA mismatch repair endonuclease MutL [Verrucomicrobia bacterium]|nr:DNA mismatch repair endonuclease MutL [Verrucomicrobiota bacterium]
MNRIQVLSEDMANKIAAGEVIERPASVVKELVENALDAGATEIEIEVGGGGRTLVRVSDNGHGMNRDDAILSMERHSTSKIHTPGDLGHITTMGFRGEALPSIASVSRLTITTCERGAETGTFVKVDGGRLINVVEVGRAPGTTVEVKQIFRNVPARRKYLRSAEREMGEIARVVDTYALAYPGVYFSLMHNGKVVALMPKADTLKERVGAVFGRQTARQMLPVEYTDHAFTITGMVGKPELTRSNRAQQYYYVNGRPFWSTGVSRAVEVGFKSLLFRGRYPVAVLFVQVDPAEVDPNVHPTKREVRFHNDWDLREAIAAAVADALRGADLAPAMGMAGRNEPQIPTDGTDRKESTTEDTESTATERTGFEEELARSSARQFWTKSGPLRPVSVGLFERQPSDLGSGEPNEETPEPETAEQAPEAPEPARRRRLKYLAQLRSSYLLAEDDDGLVVIDQHAAHERVLYERIMAALDGKGRTSQRLLVPRTIELTKREALVIEDQLALFRKMGFEVRAFGPGTYLVEATPTYMPDAAWDEVFRDILDEVDANQKEYRERPEATLITAACKAAVKAHDTLTRDESVQLLADLAACERPFTCPHGRPTMLRLTEHDLEREFKRR